MRRQERECTIVLKVHPRAVRGYLADAVEQRNLLMAEGDRPVPAAKQLIRFMQKHREVRIINSTLDIHCDVGAFGPPRKAMARECGRACALINAEIAKRGKR